MDKELIKSKIDFTNIKELEVSINDEIIKTDYLVDDKGNFIFPVSALEFKLIEKIKDLEERIKVLEDAKKV